MLGTVKYFFEIFFYNKWTTIVIFQLTYTYVQEWVKEYFKYSECPLNTCTSWITKSYITWMRMFEFEHSRAWVDSEQLLNWMNELVHA